MDTLRATPASRRLMAFGPALLLIGIMAYVASGASVVPGATAANDVTVNGSVDAGMSIAPDAGACSPMSVGNFSLGAFQTSAACTLSFATNGTSGATLTIRDADGAAPFFCHTTAACTGNGSLDNVPAVNGGSALGNDQFGVALSAVAGAPSPSAGTNFAAADPTPTNAEAVWAPVGASAATICETSAVTTATQSCSVVFGVDGQGSTQTAGSYTGTATIEAASKP